MYQHWITVFIGVLASVIAQAAYGDVQPTESVQNVMGKDSLVARSPFVPQKFSKETEEADEDETLVFNGFCALNFPSGQELVFSLLHKGSGKGFLLSSNLSEKSPTGYQFQSYRPEDHILIVKTPLSESLALAMAKKKQEEVVKSSDNEENSEGRGDEDAERRRRFERLQELRKKLMSSSDDDDD
jgi:hypothetical protein